MSHKVHPKSYRIAELADWSSRWLSVKRPAGYLQEDFKIREFLEKKLKECSVESIEIERFSDKISVIISTARPGLVIGRGGSGAEELKKELEKRIFKKTPLGKSKRELKIEIREIKDPFVCANLVGQWIAQQIEKRMPFRKTLKQSIEKVMAHKEIKGIRVEVSGRLDGSEIARREWLKSGRLPRQTIRAAIDYAQARANCTYGVIGIKVWLYKGDKI